MEKHVYQPVACQVQSTLTKLCSNGVVIEVAYRDGANRIQFVHDVVKDLFHRAGEDFVLLGRGQLVRLDRIMMIDGLTVSLF